MLIGIDGFEASVEQRVGVGRLAVEVMRNLQIVDKRNSYRVYVPNFKAHQGEPLQSSGNWDYRCIRQTRLWSQIILPFYLHKDKPRPDVFLSPVHYAPRFCPCPSVIFVFDLSYIHFSKMFKKIDLYKLVNWTRYSVKRASKVLTISKASKADIMHFYNLDSGKIKVVYPGVKMKSEIRNSKPETVLKKYGITKEYILYVGTLQPRKNLVRLIEAFDKVNSQLSTLNSQLVIVGRKGWMYDEIFAKVKELKLGKNVIFTGFVPDRDLPIFYKNAKLLALVSLYEGFGLPILEAMSYGTPVVVSNISSLPEVAGDAGVYVDPNDTGDIAKGIRKVLIMDKKQYENLSKKSKQQASKFSWERTARQILKVLEEVASS